MSLANRGKAWEEYLNMLHTRYSVDGRARIDFIPTPTKPIYRGGRTAWVPTQKSTVDYAGVLHGGRFTAFDAKSTRNRGSWRVKTGAEHQWDYLQEVYTLGGLAFYLIFAEMLDKVYILLMPFPINNKNRFTNMIEVPKNKDGWWNWLDSLELGGLL